MSDLFLLNYFRVSKSTAKTYENLKALFSSFSKNIETVLPTWRISVSHSIKAASPNVLNREGSLKIIYDSLALKHSELADGG